MYAQSMFLAKILKISSFKITIFFNAYIAWARFCNVKDILFVFSDICSHVYQSMVSDF